MINICAINSPVFSICKEDADVVVPDVTPDVVVPDVVVPDVVVPDVVVPDVVVPDEVVPPDEPLIVPPDQHLSPPVTIMLPEIPEIVPGFVVVSSCATTFRIIRVLSGTPVPAGDWPFRLPEY